VCSNKLRSPHSGFILDRSRCAEVVDFAKTSRLYRKIFGIATKNEILSAPRNSFMSLNEIDQIEYYLQNGYLKDDALPELFTRVMKSIKETYTDLGL